MTNHYYTQQPTTPHDREKWDFELLGTTFHFITDSGVFSKKRVDFGSCLLLDSLTKMPLPEGEILDVGCGYGPIGLALARFTQQEVEMIDINERAIALSKENAFNNGISNVLIHQSNLYEQIQNKEYAVIVSNPPIRAGKKVVHTILEKSYLYLKKGGKLFVVLQKKQGAPSAEKKMAEVFGNVKTIGKKKGYSILESEKQ